MGIPAGSSHSLPHLVLIPGVGRLSFTVHHYGEKDNVTEIKNVTLLNST